MTEYLDKGIKMFYFTVYIIINNNYKEMVREDAQKIGLVLPGRMVLVRHIRIGQLNGSKKRPILVQRTMRAHDQ